MSYTRATTLDPNPLGDTTKVAIVDKLDVDLSNIFTHLNSHESSTSYHGLDTVNAEIDTLQASVSGWTEVTATDYTATPASTSTLTMVTDLTASIKAGMSLKYTIGGTVYYGLVYSIAANLLTIRGAPLGGDVTSLSYGGGTLRQLVVMIPGSYEDASNTTLIATDLYSQLKWQMKPSYLVQYRAFSYTHDTGTHGKVSAKLSGDDLTVGAVGLTVAADATWYNTVVDIAVTAYDINYGETIEVSCTKGGNGNATYLTAEMTFLTP